MLQPKSCVLLDVQTPDVVDVVGLEIHCKTVAISLYIETVATDRVPVIRYSSMISSIMTHLSERGATCVRLRSEN